VNDKHPLGRLIEDTKAANGWSDEYIAARASRAGFRSSKQNIGRIKNQPVTSVKAAQIKLLAAGLDVPEITVARAAVASMGFPEIESSVEDLVEVVRVSPDLSARDKGIVSAVLTAMRSDESEQHDEEAAEPPAPIDFPEPDEAVEDDSGVGQKSLPDFLSMAAMTDEQITKENDAREQEWADRGEGSQEAPDEE
jgi:hypothetical protein